MVFTRILRNLIRDKELGPRIVPIIPDEARTFGMDPLFKEVGIYAALGQRYEPVDSDLVLSYREATDGQVLEEGITEAGSMASFQAAGTSYATHGLATIPFYIFYSMFGFQRTGDQIWQFGDARGRGFLMGATSGRTTLAGEGLQHDDGHSHIHASTIPNVRGYDPSYAYELAAIVRDGIDRMYGEKPQDVFYYITIHNENYAQPARPDGLTDEDILRGIYRFAAAPEIGKDAHRARLVGSGAILEQSIAARDLLAERFGVAAEVYSAPSFPLLRREALEAERWNRFHPDAESRGSRYVSHGAPVRGRTDHRDDGLDQAAARHGRALATRPLPRARDGRLRAQRHPRGPACTLRDRRAAHRRRHDGGARTMRGAAAGQGRESGHATSASIPTRSIPPRSELSGRPATPRRRRRIRGVSPRASFPRRAQNRPLARDPLAVDLHRTCHRVLRRADRSGDATRPLGPDAELPRVVRVRLEDPQGEPDLGAAVRRSRGPDPPAHGLGQARAHEQADARTRDQA